jgi:mannitol/fructose-specific phosphotransferase system IIA component (Ntr-type)
VKLAELFPPESIRVGLDQATKPAVIEALVHHAVDLGRLPGEAERPVVDAILAREGLGSTALGHGLAFPHCRWRSIERLVGVVGLLHRPIPFEAVDGQPVDRVFLTLTPPDNSEQSLDALSRLISIGRNKSLRLLLGGCRTPEHVSALLAELDQPVVGQLDELALMILSRPEREQTDRRRELGYFGLVQEHRVPSDRKGRGDIRPRWF